MAEFFFLIFGQMNFAAKKVSERRCLASCDVCARVCVCMTTQHDVAVYRRQHQPVTSLGSASLLRFSPNAAAARSISSQSECTVRARQ